MGIPSWLFLGHLYFFLNPQKYVMCQALYRALGQGSSTRHNPCFYRVYKVRHLIVMTALQAFIIPILQKKELRQQWTFVVSLFIIKVAARSFNEPVFVLNYSAHMFPQSSLFSVSPSPVHLLPWRPSVPCHQGGMLRWVRRHAVQSDTFSVPHLVFLLRTHPMTMLPWGTIEVLLRFILTMLSIRFEKFIKWAYVKLREKKSLGTCSSWIKSRILLFLFVLSEKMHATKSRPKAT